MKLHRRFASIVLATIGLLNAQAAIAAGALDPSFGSAGRVQTDFGKQQNHARDLAVQPDGKFVGLGTLSGATGIALVRYTTEGLVDLKVPFGPLTEVDTDALSPQTVALQPDGKIVVAGAGSSVALGSFMWAQRFHANGSIDAGFGINGRSRVVYPGGAFTSNVFRVLALPSGKLWLLGGLSHPFTDSPPAVAVLNADGTPDTTVGPGGRLLVGPTVPGGAFAGMYRDAVVSGSAVYAVGSLGMGPGANPSVLMLLDKLDAVTGRHDPSFGLGGRVEMPAMFPELINSVVAQPDGRIVVAGRSVVTASVGLTAPNPLRLRRFNLDGTLDTGFAEPTVMLVDSPLLALDGTTLWLAASAPGAGGRDLLLMRLGDSGVVDSSFGLGGSLMVDFGGGTELLARLALQADGKPLLLGTTFAGTRVDFALTRIDPLR